MVTEDLVTAPRWFRWWRPSPSTSDLIDCAWSARADGTHRLVPDGAVDVLWFPTSGALSSIWVCGPDTRSWSKAHRESAVTAIPGPCSLMV